MKKDRILRKIVNSITTVGTEIRDIGSQTTLTPVRYTVAGSGWLTEAVIAGATSVVVSTFPEWPDVKQQYIAIDPGTNECEFRMVETITIDTTGGAIVLGFTSALQYNHAEDDPVLFVTDNTVNIHWFDGLGDGVADNLIPIQRAVNQVLYNTRGVNIYFPRGLYLVSDRITIPGNKIGMFGAADTDGSVEIRMTGDFKASILYASAKEDITIRGIKFSLITGGKTIANLVEFEACTNLKITDCYFTTYGTSMATVAAIRIGIGDIINIDRNWIAYTTLTIRWAYCIELEGQIRTLSICDNTLESFGVAGIFTTAGAGSNGIQFVISDNLIRSVGPEISQYGIFLRDVIGGTIGGNVISEQEIACIYLFSTVYLAFRNIRLSNNALEGEHKVIRSGSFDQVENTDRKGEYLDGSRWLWLPTTHAGTDGFFAYCQILPATYVEEEQLVSQWVVPFAYTHNVWFNGWLYLSYPEDEFPPPGLDIYVQLEWWVFTQNSQMSAGGVRVARTGVWGPQVITLPATPYTLRITDLDIGLPCNGGNNIHFVMTRFGNHILDTFDRAVHMWGLRLDEANQ